VNCVIIDDDKISCKILEGFVEKTEGLSHFKTYYSPVGAINEQCWDSIGLIFLDVEMPDMTGLDFLKTVENPPAIILVSSNQKYALDAFDFEVKDFLLKPISYVRFYKGVKKVLAASVSKPPVSFIEGVKEEGIYVKKNNTLFHIKYDDIVFIEALENYSSIMTIDDKYVVHCNLKTVETKLPEHLFKRVHRSNIINTKRIKFIEEKFVCLGHLSRIYKVPIGKSYRENLLNNLNSL
jgi:DNA-binding LytR/AlgR family response regulator